MRTDLRLVVPAVVAWGVAAVAIATSGPSVILVGAAWAATAGWLALAIGFARAGRAGRSSRLNRVSRVGRWGATVALSLCAASVILSAVAVASPHRQLQPLAEAARAGRHVTVEATTTQTVTSGSTSFTVAVTEVGIGSDSVEAGIAARVFGAEAGDELGIGTRIALEGRMTATDPGDSIGYLLFPTDGVRVLAEPPWYLDWANSLRAGLRGTALALPGDGAALLPGLAIGDTSAVSDDLDAAMKASSLSHLTAVSGANCAIIVALIMLIGGVAGVANGWRIAASAVALIGFVVLVTPQASVLRASVMALAVLVTLALGRGTRGLPVLALSVIVLLVIDPWLSRDYGFALSVLATGGLLVLAGPLAQVLTRWIPRPLAVLLAVPVAAQLACQPVLVLLSPSISVIGVAANVLAAPAAPVATIIGLVSCLVGAVSPPLGLAAAWVAWLPAAWIAAVARFAAGCPGGSLPWAEGPPGAVALVVITAIALGAILLRRGSRARLIAIILISGTLVSIAAGVAGTALHLALTRPADWQYAMCDVGQGDASLVRSGGEVALIDTGPEPEALEECLGDLGIRHLDLLILSHFDLDHVGGTSAVVGRVDRVLVGPTDGAEDDRLNAGLAAAGARLQPVRAGDSGTLGELQWRVIWPREPLGGVAPGNDASVTVVFDDLPCDSVCDRNLPSALFMGDLGEEAQTRLRATRTVPIVDVVKVAHHGSADQSAPLYDQIDAAIGLIGVGAENTYGHPTDRTLGVLRDDGIEALRTDRDGLILLAPSNDGTLEVWTERDG